tara:strand:+ start:283 stop:1137 length:855 start_codon:yes stop_codon:yes gene_type:complete
MKKLHTFKVHFWLKKNSIRNNGTIPIYARIRFDGNPADISTKLEILEEHWSIEAGRAKLKFKDSRQINGELDAIYADILECKRSLESEGRILTAKDIKSRFSGQDSTLKTLKDLLRYHRTNEMANLRPGTAKNYNATEKYLLLFLQKWRKRSDIELEQINYEFVVDFERYLRTCAPLIRLQPLTNNGIMKHLERFKKMTTIALKLEAIKKDPFTFFKARFESYDRAVLTIGELDALATAPLDDIGQQRVRDVFVFACYTTQIYARVMETKIGKDMAVLKRKLGS